MSGQDMEGHQMTGRYGSDLIAKTISPQQGASLWEALFDHSGHGERENPARRMVMFAQDWPDMPELDERSYRHNPTDFMAAANFLRSWAAAVEERGREIVEAQEAEKRKEREAKAAKAAKRKPVTASASKQSKPAARTHDLDLEAKRAKEREKKRLYRARKAGGTHAAVAS